MSLTFRSGPFGARPAGRFNADLQVPDSLLYFERSPLRIRALFAGETVVDSRRTMLLHESGHLPVYWFPRDDVRGDLLVAGERSERILGRANSASTTWRWATASRAPRSGRRTARCSWRVA